MADVGIAGRVSADTCDTHPAFAQLLVNSKQLGLDFVADPLGIVRRRQQRQLDLIQAATGTDYPIKDNIPHKPPCDGHAGVRGPAACEIKVGGFSQGVALQYKMPAR